MKPLPRRSLLRIALLCAALVLLGNAGYLQAKAWLAQQLLEQAWQRRLAGDAEARPWPWADTQPLARLRVPRLALEQIVLSGDSGRTLAFGPAWNEGSARFGAAGTSVISGHRDTHFAFLRNVEVGDTLELSDLSGSYRYRVEAHYVADARQQRIAATGGEERLLLVTCYPFDDWVAGGPLRFVVEARRVE